MDFSALFQIDDNWWLYLRDNHLIEIIHLNHQDHYIEIDNEIK